MDPDVNSPSARLYVSITKRAEKMSEEIDFLTKILQIMATIKELRGGTV